MALEDPVAVRLLGESESQPENPDVFPQRDAAGDPPGKRSREPRSGRAARGGGKPPGAWKSVSKASNFYAARGPAPEGKAVRAAKLLRGASSNWMVTVGPPAAGGAARPRSGKSGSRRSLSSDPASSSKSSLHSKRHHGHSSTSLSRKRKVPKHNCDKPRRVSKGGGGGASKENRKGTAGYLRNLRSPSPEPEIPSLGGTSPAGEEGRAGGPVEAGPPSADDGGSREKAASANAVETTGATATGRSEEVASRTTAAAEKSLPKTLATGAEGETPDTDFLSSFFIESASKETDEPVPAGKPGPGRGGDDASGIESAKTGTSEKRGRPAPQGPAKEKRSARSAGSTTKQENPSPPRLPGSPGRAQSRSPSRQPGPPERRTYQSPSRSSNLELRQRSPATSPDPSASQAVAAKRAISSDGPGKTASANFLRPAGPSTSQLQRGESPLAEAAVILTAAPEGELFTKDQFAERIENALEVPNENDRARRPPAGGQEKSPEQPESVAPAPAETGRGLEQRPRSGGRETSNELLLRSEERLARRSASSLLLTESGALIRENVSSVFGELGSTIWGNGPLGDQEGSDGRPANASAGGADGQQPPAGNKAASMVDFYSRKLAAADFDRSRLAHELTLLRRSFTSAHAFKVKLEAAEREKRSRQADLTDCERDISEMRERAEKERHRTDELATKLESHMQQLFTVTEQCEWLRKENARLMDREKRLHRQLSRGAESRRIPGEGLRQSLELTSLLEQIDALRKEISRLKVLEHRLAWQLNGSSRQEVTGRHLAHTAFRRGSTGNTADRDIADQVERAGPRQPSAVSAMRLRQAVPPGQGRPMEFSGVDGETLRDVRDYCERAAAGDLADATPSSCLYGDAADAATFYPLQRANDAAQTATDVEEIGDSVPAEVASAGKAAARAIARQAGSQESAAAPHSGYDALANLSSISAYAQTSNGGDVALDTDDVCEPDKTVEKAESSRVETLDAEDRSKLNALQNDYRQMDVRINRLREDLASLRQNEDVERRPGSRDKFEHVRQQVISRIEIPAQKIRQIISELTSGERGAEGDRLQRLLEYVQGEELHVLNAAIEVKAELARLSGEEPAHLPVDDFPDHELSHVIDLELAAAETARQSQDSEPGAARRPAGLLSHAQPSLPEVGRRRKVGPGLQDETTEGTDAQRESGLLGGSQVGEPSRQLGTSRGTASESQDDEGLRDVKREPEGINGDSAGSAEARRKLPRTLESEYAALQSDSARLRETVERLHGELLEWRRRAAEQGENSQRLQQRLEVVSKELGSAREECRRLKETPVASSSDAVIALPLDTGAQLHDMIARDLSAGAARDLFETEADDGNGAADPAQRLARALARMRFDMGSKPSPALTALARAAGEAVTHMNDLREENSVLAARARETRESGKAREDLLARRNAESREHRSKLEEALRRWEAIGRAYQKMWESVLAHSVPADVREARAASRRTPPAADGRNLGHDQRGTNAGDADPQFQRRWNHPFPFWDYYRHLLSATQATTQALSHLEQELRRSKRSDERHQHEAVSTKKVLVRIEADKKRIEKLLHDLTATLERAKLERESMKVKLEKVGVGFRALADNAGETSGAVCF